MRQPRPHLVSSIGLLILRLGVGGLMATHGWGKLQMVLEGRFDEFSDPVKLGSATGLVLVTFAEFFCALFVMLGFATRLASIPVVVAMSVAAFAVHGNDPWTMGEGARLFLAGEAQSWASKEPALLFLVPFLALIFTGAGCISVDAWIANAWRRRRSDAMPEAG